MKWLFLASALIVAGCQTVRYVPCPDPRLPQPEFPDTAKAIAEVPPGDIKGLVGLLVKGRAARDQRLSEDNEAFKACAKVQ